MQSVGLSTVEPLNPFASETVEYFNLNAVLRKTLSKTQRSNRWLASVFGQSEQLTQVQLADDHPEKHCSLRKLGRIGTRDKAFWKEFFLLGLNQLGFKVVVFDEAQYEAFYQLQASSAKFNQEMTK